MSTQTYRARLLCVLCVGTFEDLEEVGGGDVALVEVLLNAEVDRQKVRQLLNLYQGSVALGIVEVKGEVEEAPDMPTKTMMRRDLRTLGRMAVFHIAR